MIENDRCIRCFHEEVIKHIILECSKRNEVWESIGVRPVEVTDILDMSKKIWLGDQSRTYKSSCIWEESHST